MYFTLLSGKAAAVIKKLLIQPSHVEPDPIIPVTVTTDFDIIDTEDIIDKVIYISTSASSYVVKFPCPLNID